MEYCMSIDSGVLGQHDNALVHTILYGSSNCDINTNKKFLKPSIAYIFNSGGFANPLDENIKPF